LALMRGLLAASRVPGADVIVDTAAMLRAHVGLPLADGEEAMPLPVLSACLDLDGSAAILDAVEEAEADDSVSAATTPDSDDRIGGRWGCPAALGGGGAAKWSGGRSFGRRPPARRSPRQARQTQSTRGR
jgi:hypothetical protein